MVKKDSKNKENAPLWQVCGAIVQCKPEKMASVRTALLALPNTEVHAASVENGKLVVVMQADSQKELANLMEQAREIKGVITVSLVYHQIDDN